MDLKYELPVMFCRNAQQSLLMLSIEVERILLLLSVIIMD